MRLFLMHLADGPAARDPREEASIVVPGAPEKVAFAVPLGALDRFLPQLAAASAELDQTCPCCGAPLAVVPPRWQARC